MNFPGYLVTNDELKYNVIINIIQFFQTSFTLRLREDEYILAIIDSLLLLLIIGRWILPRKGLSKDQLSLLLLLYVAIASDIMELFVLFEEDFVITHNVLVYIILSVWTLSLAQFIIVLTAIRGHHTPEAIVVNETGFSVKKVNDDPNVSDATLMSEVSPDHASKGSETAAIVFALFVQDIPFLSVRLYVLITYKTLSYNIIFFSLKNVLVILASLFRIYSVIIKKVSKSKENYVTLTLPRDGNLNTLTKDGFVSGNNAAGRTSQHKKDQELAINGNNAAGRTSQHKEDQDFAINDMNVRSGTLPKDGYKNKSYMPDDNEAGNVPL